MPDFLLELRSEEIPARMQDDARQNLKRLFEAELANAGIKPDNIATYATPRRLTLIAYGLPLETLAASEELKGPKTSAPPQALEGFLRKNGLTQSQLVDRDGVYFATIDEPGRRTADILAEAIPAIIRAFPWPKSMRWGGASASTEMTRWVRPLQGIVALLGDNIVRFEVAGVLSDCQTIGHRFLHSGPITITSANSDEYEDKLRNAFVIVNQEERRAIIYEGAQRAAADAGLILVQDPSLVDENAGLTEWPVPLLGRFDEAFLDVPPEVIQLTARTNQKYFICRERTPEGAEQGKLANAFICTANIVATDGGAAIVDGNRKVLAARLADARFFWEQDRKKTLSEHAEGLARITFHEKLGTVADKVERVAKLARWLVEEGIVTETPLPGGEGLGVGVPTSQASNTHPQPLPTREGALLADQAELAARLCKADLVTEMVGEFPELQGVIGGYYAADEGLPQAVAEAIRDHYKPVGQGDDVPTAPVTVAVSLADKLDTLCQFFLIDEAPTGSKDPFALRRASLSIISLILSNNLRFRLQDVLIKAVEDDLAKFEVVWFGNLETKLASFLADRLKVQQREAGVRHDLIDAVFALGGEDDLVCLLARVHALQAFIGTEDGTNLLAGYKRAANILKKEGFTAPLPGGEGLGVGVPPLASNPHPNPSPTGKGFKETLSYTPEPAEKALMDALSTAGPQAAAAVVAEDFAGAMAALATLRSAVDAFFDAVTVNDPEPAKREARLGLLARFRDAVHGVADFSKIEG